jgi:hypothetical protein
LSKFGITPTKGEFVMDLSNWLSIGAVIAASVLAVVITKVVDSHREKRQDRMSIFRTLTSQYFDLTHQRVEAINLIEIVFYGCKDVIDEYRQYRNLLKNEQSKPADIDDKYLLILEKMAKVLGFKNINWIIFKNIYKPDGIITWQRNEQEKNELLMSILRHWAKSMQSPSQLQSQSDIK